MLNISGRRDSVSSHLKHLTVGSVGGCFSLTLICLRMNHDCFNVTPTITNKALAEVQGVQEAPFFFPSNCLRGNAPQFSELLTGDQPFLFEGIGLFRVEPN
jgi:hypothetical protein